MVSYSENDLLDLELKYRRLKDDTALEMIKYIKFMQDQPVPECDCDE